MPGIVTHSMAGIIIGAIGLYYYREFFKDNPKKQLILIAIALFFSFLPDIFLAIYYVTHILSFDILVYYHRFSHMLFPIVAFIFLMLFRFDPKRKPYWAVALCAIVVHLAMDLLIQETGPFF
jgi:hypothetical protein